HLVKPEQTSVVLTRKFCLTGGGRHAIQEAPFGEYAILGINGLVYSTEGLAAKSLALDSDRGAWVFRALAAEVEGRHTLAIPALRAFDNWTLQVPTPDGQGTSLATLVSPAHLE